MRWNATRLVSARFRTMVNSNNRAHVTGEISLREITSATVRDIIALEVAPLQRSYVASNAVSLAEAHFNPGAWFRAIYAGETSVGFIMLFIPTAQGAVAREPIKYSDVGLWRFMVDHRYQGRGYGWQALDLARSHVRSLPDVTRLISSYVPGPHGPEKFYLHYGFQPTGHLRANGTEIEIWMEP
jgi:diamine N-acetyltransferase